MENLGPVDDIEQHLKTDWWKKIFNSMYLKTDADVVQDNKMTAHEVNLFVKFLDLDKSDVILDLACGQGRHLAELSRREYKNLFGLDRSHYLIQKARRNAKKENLNINFKEGDVRKLPYRNDIFDCITILGNSFGYFEKKEDDKEILKEVSRVLKPDGKLLMDVADGSYLKENFTARSWEWIDKKHFVCRERALATDNERLISREVITHTEKGVIVDQFYAERLYSKEKLSALLKETGFENITYLSSIEPQSLRNQDLGMMEKRFVVTAVARKEWSPKKSRKKVKNVAVIMGDPHIHDTVKPDAVFDEDDFEAINKLKEALTVLKDYKFHYVNKHGSLIDEIKNMKGKIDFVFNLCDEGFNNEAVKELHVPALLEMVNIPYTGSRPQNLAYCYDKSLIRGIALQIGVPVADAFIIKPEQNYFDMAISFPVITKPNYGDSSFGITQKSVAYSIENLDEAIRKTRQQFGYRKPILVEEFLPGKELTIGIIGNPPGKHKVLPIIEEDYSDLPDNLPKICGYEAKWLPSSPYFTHLKSIPASLPKHIEEQIIDGSLQLFERLECRDYCRFDWRLDGSGNPRLLEVNPNPGWCWDGHLAKMSKEAGMDYGQMLNAILEAAEQRIKRAAFN